MSLSFESDGVGGQALLTPAGDQVMMTWEKPYMEAIVDAMGITPECRVLEIGFGLAFSANRIHTYRPAAHTIVECSDVVLERLGEWAADKPGVCIAAGRWQDVLPSLGTFDRVFFDDYPLDDVISVHRAPWSRWHEFLDDLFLGGHVCAGTLISGYLARNDVDLERPGCTVRVLPFQVAASETCRYFDSPVAYIPLITVCGGDGSGSGGSSFADSFTNKYGAMVSRSTRGEQLLERLTTRLQAAGRLGTVEEGSDVDTECATAECAGASAADGAAEDTFASPASLEATRQRRERLAQLRTQAGLPSSS